MEDKEVKKIYLYKFYVNGKEKKFKDSITVNIIPDKDYLIFSVEKGDLMLHTVANTIDEGLKNVLEILEEDWKQYAFGELDNLSERAIEYGKYLKSLVEK